MIQGQTGLTPDRLEDINAASKKAGLPERTD